MFLHTNWLLKGIFTVFIIIISILAFLVRGYYLDLFPLNHDEINGSLRCIENFDKFLGIPVTCFKGYIQPLFSYLLIFSRKLFSVPEFIVRMPAVILGTFTVLLIYLVTKEIYDKKIALTSAIILCFLPWHVLQSRIGVSAILVPLVGCLIFYILFLSLKKKSNLLFILSWFCLSIGAFYTYQSSLFYILIFIFGLFFLRKEFIWLKPKIILISILSFLIVLFPLFYLQMLGKIDLISNFYRYYHRNPFQGNIFENFKNNVKNNAIVALKSLFWNSNGIMLYGAAFKSPLLINPITFILILFVLLFSIYKHTTADKVIIIWLCIGFLGSLTMVNFFQPRYLIIILVPLVIIIGKSLVMIFKYISNYNFLKFLFIIFCASLVFIEFFQLWNYYKIAPTNLEECRRNSYGCKEAAKFLASLSDVENYYIKPDFRMTVCGYLKYFTNKTINCDILGNPTFVIVWAPESHPKDYWQGYFRQMYEYLKHKYPDNEPIKTIFYPNGIPALYIFRLEKDVLKNEKQ